MRRALLIIAVAAMAALMVLPAAAYGQVYPGLTNEYGMHFAGQAACLDCHPDAYGETVHGRFSKSGIVPEAPEGWDYFKAAGMAEGEGPTLPSPDYSDNTPYFASGQDGWYPVNLPWLTLGDFEGGAATEYLVWKGSTDATKNPWRLVEGLVAEPNGEWIVGEGGDGLYDVLYGCQRCHMLGTTTKLASVSDTATVPNPAVKTAATATTGATWARAVGTSVNDFLTDPEVSEPGMSIQCEACHGTGLDTAGIPGHWNSGTEISHRAEGATASTLGDSQVCGQCHGSYTTVSTATSKTLGIYGYTPNLPMRNFVNINGLTGGVAYTYTPTEAEFMANPTKYQLFPNGSNARGNHFYYNEWSTSGHAYRGAYFNATTGHSEDPDKLVGGMAGHYNAKTSGLDCARCHTGEGYLNSKDASIFADMTITNANSGFMGQECVTCHDAHPAGVGHEGNIREGDAAGVRSNATVAGIAAAGLPANTYANATVCEDCHNWQLEVQGLAPTIKPQASLASRGGPSHPQRETVHGRSLLEVAEAGEFMPNATCEECHMPKTNRNENRYSHGMHIMRPGDAEKWQTAAGYTKGEDSCSKCHPGLTRAELEEELETWQANTTTYLNNAKVAIEAAQAGGFSEYSLTDAAKPGYILVARATWNYKAVGSDGSNGAHNPRYVRNGLQAAERMAKSVGGSFKLVAASSSIAQGNLGFVAGKVVNGDGTGAAGAKLTLVGTGLSTTSDANGNFAFTVAPTATTTYSVKWERSSIAATHLTSASQTISVVAPTSPVVNVYRFYNVKNGSHFYTASDAEKANIIAKYPAVYTYEGVAYQLNTASPAMNAPLYRFYNKVNGAHFYTISEAEKANIIAKYAATYTYEGVAYNVASSAAGNAPVYRFYNVTNGTHFYTASDAEKANVIAKYPKIFTYEGIAFYLAPIAG